MNYNRAEFLIVDSDKWTIEFEIFASPQSFVSRIICYLVIQSHVMRVFKYGILLFKYVLLLCCEFWVPNVIWQKKPVDLKLNDKMMKRYIFQTYHIYILSYLLIAIIKVLHDIWLKSFKYVIVVYIRKYFYIFVWRLHRKSSYHLNLKTLNNYVHDGLKYTE